MLGDLLGSLTGRTQRRYTDRANREAQGYLREGQQGGENALRTGYEGAIGYLNPYAQQGQHANALYGRAMGLDGADARRQFMAEYAGNDPFRQHNEEQANRGLARRYAAMGFAPGGGTSGLAMARASLDRGAQDYENYMNRLAGLQGQGLAIAGQQAGYASGYGNSLAGLRSGFAQQNAANAINYGNAQAANSGILGQNLLSLGGLALSAMGGRGAGALGSGAAGQRGMSRGLNYYGDRLTNSDI